MSEYLQVRSNGQITLPADTRRKAKLREGDLLEAVVEEDGSIRLVPKNSGDRALAEKYPLKDVAWARKQKGSKKRATSFDATQFPCVSWARPWQAICSESQGIF